MQNQSLKGGGSMFVCEVKALIVSFPRMSEITNSMGKSCFCVFLCKSKSSLKSLRGPSPSEVTGHKVSHKHTT